MAKVLMVGNDIEHVDIIAYSAEGLGYETVCTYDSIDTVKLAISETVDLVILEEKMNGFTGYEASSNLRTDPDVPAELPILMTFTGIYHDNDLHKAGVTDVLPWELDPAAFREILVKYTGE